MSCLVRLCIVALDPGRPEHLLICSLRSMVMRRFLVMTLVVAWSVPALGGSPFQDLQPNARPHLKSIYSSVHDVQEFTKGESRGIALVFLGTECPVARQYLPRLNELSDE